MVTALLPMRDILYKPLFVFGIITLLLVAVLTVSTVRTARAASDEAPKSGERIVVVHDGTVKRGFLTDETTVSDALKEAGVELDANDLVEPALDEKLVASSYDVNIYRARPVTIIDGSVRKKVMSAYRTPAQIVRHADMELRDEDIAKFSLSVNPADGAVTQLTIDRATPLTLVLYGKKTTVYTQGETVAELLEEKEITLGESDRLSVGGDEPITENMTIELWREGKQTITEEEEVDFEVEKIQDVDREVGYREVRTKGVPGRRSVTYEIEMKNGKEVSRKEIQSVVLTKPKKQVEVVGAKPAVTPYTGGGNKDSWLAASAIPRDQWGNAEWLVQKESGWNPNAVNPSSGACGLGQQLPCGKWAGAWNDPVASLNGMHGYVMGRYGSWDAAVAHSRANGWY